MTHWNETVVTDIGNEMLNEMMAGRFLTVTAAHGGTGLVDTGELAKQTDLLARKQTVKIINDETTSEGRTITLQIANADEEYELNQIGIFAKLDAARDPQAEEKLLCIMQDRQEKGAIIVPSTEDPAFVLELYCVIKISNNGRFEVTVDKTGIVSLAYLEKELAKVKPVPGEGAPTPETVGQPGQHYFDAETGTEYICKKVDEDGTCVWEEVGSATITGDAAPTPETVGQPGQHYFDETTGVEYICKKVNGDGTYVWEETGNTLIDDADQETRYRLGVENGKLYIQTVEEE